ncbi:hypothetical protein HDU98_004864 [Podochytrium sp. JEL0797]|nr:hypothetical protein HDU98_004864 [Podochytrium sp. JEL0797]
MTNTHPTSNDDDDDPYALYLQSLGAAATAPMDRSANMSLPVALERSSSSHRMTPSTRTTTTSLSGLSLESLPSMTSSASSRKPRAATLAGVPRPSLAAIQGAGFLEKSDPHVALRFLLMQPNCLYGIIRREKAKRNWLGRDKSTWTPYLTVLYGDKLIQYHTTRKDRYAAQTDTMNGPFYSLGSSIQNYLDAPTVSSNPHFLPPTISPNSLHDPPSSVLRLTTESEIHVSEKGVYVLRVTGKKMENTADSASFASVSSTSATVLDFGFLEDKTWMLQFENPESMMEWMTVIKNLLADMAKVRCSVEEE